MSWKLYYHLWETGKEKETEKKTGKKRRGAKAQNRTGRKEVKHRYWKWKRSTKKKWKRICNNFVKCFEELSLLTQSKWLKLAEWLFRSGHSHPCSSKVRENSLPKTMSCGVSVSALMETLQLLWPRCYTVQPPSCHQDFFCVKKFFLYISVVQVASCPLTGHHSEQPGSLCFAPFPSLQLNSLSSQILFMWAVPWSPFWAFAGLATLSQCLFCIGSPALALTLDMPFKGAESRGVISLDLLATLLMQQFSGTNLCKRLAL